MRISRIQVAILCASGLMTAAQTSAQPVNIDTVPIYSLGLEITTCDRNDAGTDDHVYVSFSASPASRYALRRPQNERRRDTVDYYDILMAVPGTGVVYGSYLQGLYLYKEGTDRWDVCRVALYVNQLNTPVWEAVGQFSLNGRVGYQYERSWSSAQLRGTGWTNAPATVRNPPTVIGASDLEMYFETVQGHENFTNNRVSWGRRDGDKWVGITPAGTSRMHVDADLEWTPSGILTPQADYDENILLSCNTQGRAVATLSSWSMECSSAVQGYPCATDFHYTHGWFKRALDRTLAGVNALGGSNSCSEIHLDVNGSIYF